MALTRSYKGACAMSGLHRAERSAHRLGALVAIAAASTALPGMMRVVRERGPAGGRPELVFTPLRLLLIGVGWFGAAAAGWRPLPVRPGHTARWVLLAGGLGLYLAGMGLALAGRLALGASYRPSSTLGATLAPNHRLVTSGPFAIVRHPMYLGLALAALGALAVYRTWSTVLFVLHVPVLVVRAHREEELLARTFGEAWERYAARVPAWLPGLSHRSRVVPAETADALGASVQPGDPRPRRRLEIKMTNAGPRSGRMALAMATVGTRGAACVARTSRADRCTDKGGPSSA